MKLRNKKTGEIVEGTDILALMATGDDLSLPVYRSLAELNEEWEDYKEPKRHWIIDTMNDRVEDFDVPMAFNESIGNYFETREEAEKAVEKLKAWKRLKDKGFRFERWLLGGEYGNTVTFSDYFKSDDEARADLDLLFSGEVTPTGGEEC